VRSPDRLPLQCDVNLSRNPVARHQPDVRYPQLRHGELPDLDHGGLAGRDSGSTYFVTVTTPGHEFVGSASSDVFDYSELIPTVSASVRPLVRRPTGDDHRTGSSRVQRSTRAGNSCVRRIPRRACRRLTDLDHRGRADTDPGGRTASQSKTPERRRAPTPSRLRPEWAQMGV